MCPIIFVSCGYVEDRYSIEKFQSTFDRLYEKASPANQQTIARQ
jgi:hypothetical protein